MVTLEMKTAGEKFPQYIEGVRSMKAFVNANPLDGWKKRVTCFTIGIKQYREVEYYADTRTIKIYK